MRLRFVLLGLVALAAAAGCASDYRGTLGPDASITTIDAGSGDDASAAADGGAPDATADAPGVASLVVRANIDGLSELVIDPQGLHWHNASWSVPGRNNGANDPTTVNGVDWQPNWPALDGTTNTGCVCDSSTLTTALPHPSAIAQTVTVAVRTARGPVTVRQQPTDANAFTTIVDLDDGSFGASDWYEIAVTYR